MEKFYAMAQVQASLFVYLAVGYLIRKRGIITPEVRGGITNLLIFVFLPCMVFESLHMDMDLQQLLSGGLILVASFAASFFAWGVGKVLFQRRDPSRRTIMRYGTLVANSGFAGLPVIQGAYGAEGLFFASIYIIPNRIFMWTAGISMFQKGKKTNWVRDVLLNPGIIAVFLGLARMLLQIPLPSFVDTAVSSMGQCTTSVSIILVGSILADVEWRSIFQWDVFYACIVRLILLPVVSLVVLKLIGFDSLGTAISVILTGMPMGTTTAILAEKYGQDAGFGSSCVFLSTVLSLVTIPMLTIFL